MPQARESPTIWEYEIERVAAAAAAAAVAVAVAHLIDVVVGRRLRGEEGGNH